MKRIHELETIVDMMRLNESQGVRNRDMTITVYQNKVQELTMRLAEKQFIEEHYREVQESLREKEDAYARLQHEYQMLQEESNAQQKSYSEQIKTYEQACKQLEQHISLSDKHHQTVVEQFQTQVNALLEEKDGIQKKMRDVEDHGRIIEAELAQQRRIRGSPTTVLHSASEAPRPVPQPTPVPGAERASVITIDPNEPRYDNTVVSTGTVLTPRRTAVVRSSSVPSRSSMTLVAIGTPLTTPAIAHSVAVTNGAPATGSQSGVNPAPGVLSGGYGGAVQTPRREAAETPRIPFMQMQHRDASPARQPPAMMAHVQSASFGMPPLSARKSLIVGPANIIMPNSYTGPQQPNTGPVRAVQGMQGIPRTPSMQSIGTVVPAQ